MSTLKSYILPVYSGKPVLQAEVRKLDKLGNDMDWGGWC